MIIKQMWISNLLYKLFGRLSSNEEVDAQAQALIARYNYLASKGAIDEVDGDLDEEVDEEPVVKKKTVKTKKKTVKKKVEVKDKKKLTSKKSKLLLG